MRTSSVSFPPGKSRCVLCAILCYLVLTHTSPRRGQLLHKYSTIVCLDSTHNTCFSVTRGGRQEKTFLYTLIVKNRMTGKGAPAAFLLTPSEAQYVFYSPYSTAPI